MSDTGFVVEALEGLRIELEVLRAELAQRRPVAWDVNSDGLTVVCSDGAIFWTNHGSSEWGAMTPVPGTPAAAAQVTR